MDKEHKIEFAKEKIGLKDVNVEIVRKEKINADYIFVPNTRGTASLIIGDDGTFLFCQSAHDYSYWQEEYIKGIRSNK